MGTSPTLIIIGIETKKLYTQLYQDRYQEQEDSRWLVGQIVLQALTDMSAVTRVPHSRVSCAASIHVLKVSLLSTSSSIARALSQPIFCP